MADPGESPPELQPELPADDPPHGPFPVTIWDLLLVAGVVVGLSVALAGTAAILWALAQGVPPGKAKPDQTLVLIASGLQALVMFGAVWLLVLRRLGMTWRDIGFRPAATGWIVGAAFLAIPLMPLVSGLTVGFQKLTGRPVKSPQIGMLAPDGFTWHGAIGLILLAGILIPVMEEVLFRGLLFRWLRKRWSAWPAILTSAVIFGVAHMIPDTIPGTATIGILLAWLYERTGSLWIPVVTHVTYNTLLLLILFTAMAAGVQIPT